MRYQLNKLIRNHSTKAERKFAEVLKANHVPFKTKVKVGGREIDFLIGRYAVEVDAHKQDPIKNKMLVEHGFIPLHFNNWELKAFEEWVKTQQTYAITNRSRN